MICKPPDLAAVQSQGVHSALVNGLGFGVSGQWFDVGPPDGVDQPPPGWGGKSQGQESISKVVAKTTFGSFEQADVVPCEGRGKGDGRGVHRSSD
jgi:hypothetical protein